jgi:hypothetical protein
MSAAPLGIIAGGGRLPGDVAAAAQAAGRDVFIVALQGFAEPDVVAPYPHRTFRMDEVGAIRQALQAHRCTELVIIGPVKRPSIFSLRPDAEGVKMLARIGRAAFTGDDGLLGAVLRVLGEDGFHVIGAHEILGGALGKGGLLTTVAPDEAALADIRRGVEVLKIVGAADIGQACVVQQGIVLAVEAVEGTDAMLSRVAELARPGPAGVLVKLAKPGQERRADLPTIGVETIRHVRNAGLRGVAFEAGSTILANGSLMIEAANAEGIFLLGVEL